MRKKKPDIVWFVLSLKWIPLGLVMFYKLCLSPLLPNRCAYYPSCSTYMFSCITRHGIIKGISFGTYRLLRCNPFTKGGYDPIPYKKGDYKWLY